MEVQVLKVFGSVTGKSKLKKQRKTMLVEWRRGCFTCTSTQTSPPIPRQHGPPGEPGCDHLPQGSMGHLENQAMPVFQP